MHHLLESLNLDSRDLQTLTEVTRVLLNEIEKRKASGLIKLNVDDFNNKMWTRNGKTTINKNKLYSLAERLNDSCDFECFAMRDVVSNTCGLAVIVPNGHFNTERQVEEFINNSSCGNNYCSLWIRESSYETEDHRFYDEIPTEILISKFEGENSSSFVVKKSHSLSVKETLGAVGFTCGPYVDADGNWGNYDVQSLWIFSKFKDLIPIHFPTDILGGKYVVIRAAQQLCGKFDARTVDQSLLSGLKVELELILDGNPQNVSEQSLGPFIAVTKRDDGVIQKGYLTTIHGEIGYFQTSDGINHEYNTTLKNNSTLCYSIKDNAGKYTDNEAKLQAATCSDLKFDDRVPVNIDNVNYTVGVDFCIAMDENAICTTVLHKKDDRDVNEIGGVTKDLNEIVGMNEIANGNLGVIYKVGFKTGNTKANHIGTLVMFNAKKKKSSDGCYNFKNGLFWFEKQHLLLAHSPPTSQNDGSFMMSGDSGGLCYIETNDSILKGVGICIGRLAPSNFYAILPLALIEAVYKEKGYNVRWNAIDDVNGDENTKVDDDTTSA